MNSKFKFISLLILVVVILIFGIYFIVSTINFNRNLMAFKDRLDLMLYLDKEKDDRSILKAKDVFSKKILNHDELEKIVFYLKQVSNSANLPSRDYDLKLAFPINYVDIYFMSDDEAIIDAQLPKKRFIYKIKYYGLHNTLENIYKNNAPN